MNHVRRRQHPPTITALLMVDHLNLRGLLDLIEDAETVRQATRLLREVGRRLSVHELVEDRLLMPAVMAARKTLAPILRFRSVRGHDEVRHAFSRLKSTDEAGFEARALAFVARLRQHLAEEEEGLFMLAREVLPAARLRELGKQMRALLAAARADDVLPLPRRRGHNRPA